MNELDPERVDAVPTDAGVERTAHHLHRPGSSPFETGRPSSWPRLHADVIGAVFLGGCVGGWSRYAVGVAWPTPPHAFPTATLAVNLLGAFVLAVVVVVAAEIRPSRYLRPLLGTGLCGALTTFSTVVVALAQLLARGAYAVAAGYLAATVIGGLAAAALGLALTRAVVTSRRTAPATTRTAQPTEPPTEGSA